MDDFYLTKTNHMYTPFQTLGTSMLFISLLAIMSCEKDPSTIPDHINNSGEPDIETYFQRFVLEGNARGESIPTHLNGIAAEFANLTGQNVIGLCTQISTGENRVVIDRTFWSQADDLQKERVVFHELGHCYLNRSHKNGKLSNGYCNSVMNSGSGNCTILYSTTYRQFYIDELFDPNTNSIHQINP